MSQTPPLNKDQFKLTSFECLAQGAKRLYGSVTRDASLVSPTNLLIGLTKKIAASELKIGEDNSRGVHFNKTNLMDYLTETSNVPTPTQFKRYLNSFLEDVKVEDENYKMMKNILSAQYTVWHNLCLVNGEIHNESELRFVLGNPIMQMLCTTFDLQVIYSLVISNYFK